MWNISQIYVSCSTWEHVLDSPDNVSELKPKSGLDEDITEAIFLLRY